MLALLYVSKGLSAHHAPAVAPGGATAFQDQQRPLRSGTCMVKKLKHFVHKAFRDLAFTLPTAYLPQRCHASYA